MGNHIECDCDWRASPTAQLVMRRGGDNSGWGSDDHMMAMEEGSQDASITALREKMALIKDMSNVMGDEIREQNDMIDGIDTDMQGARNQLAKAMKHAKELLAQAGSRHMCYLFLFVLMFFFLLWKLL